LQFETAASTTADKLSSAAEYVREHDVKSMILAAIRSAQNCKKKRADDRTAYHTKPHEKTPGSIRIYQSSSMFCRLAKKYDFQPILMLCKNMHAQYSASPDPLCHCCGG